MWSRVVVATAVVGALAVRAEAAEGPARSGDDAPAFAGDRAWSPYEAESVRTALRRVEIGRAHV